jgi:hypothetical protein
MIVETIEKTSRVSVLSIIPFIENRIPEKVAGILERCPRFMSLESSNLCPGQKY